MTLWRRLRISPGEIAIEFERTVLPRGAEPRLTVRVAPGATGRDLPGRFGVEITLVLDAGVRRRVITLRCDRSDRDAWFQLPPMSRGLYGIASMELALPDPFRLSALVIVPEADAETRLRVVPRPEDVRSITEVHGSGGVDLESYLSMQRNDDLIEARPYHPGDDATRLHWNLYAHTGELFVRLGEEVPPPRRSVVVTVDGGAAGDDRSEAGAGTLDRVIEYALGLARSLERREFTVAIALTMNGAIHNLGDTGAATRVLAALDADGRLREPPPSVPVDGRATMLVVTSGHAQRCPPDLRGNSVIVLVMDEINGSRVQRAWNARPLD